MSTKPAKFNAKTEGRGLAVAVWESHGPGSMNFPGEGHDFTKINPMVIEDLEDDLGRRFTQKELDAMFQAYRTEMLKYFSKHIKAANSAFAILNKTTKCNIKAKC